MRRINYLVMAPVQEECCGCGLKRSCTDPQDDGTWLCRTCRPFRIVSHDGYLLGRLGKFSQPRVIDNVWSVLVEAKGPEGVQDPADLEEAADRFMDHLKQWSGVVTAGQGRWSARVTIIETQALEAVMDAAEKKVPAAAAEAGLPAWDIVRLEVVRDDELEAELGRTPWPELVGTTEAGQMLGVTRQRIHELRTQGRFPAPMVKLAAGPIWLRSAIEAFLERWDRKPGRPSKA